MTVTCNEKLLHFEFPHALNFSCTGNEEASSCWLNIVMFRYNFAYKVNPFVVSVNVTVRIHNL